MATDALSLVFSALADPTRRAILAGLAEGPKPVGEIGEPFSLTGPAITKHLKVLEKAGLIRVDKKR
ncbi:MAG: metalloregulator ArsR/SmtB family transcription factor, partial [Armatimonadota bacterium]